MSLASQFSSSYVPLARLDADGEKTEQGGLGTTEDADLETAKNIAASASQTGAGGSNHSKPAANDAESRYWASLNAAAQERAQTLQVEDWGNGTTGQATGTTGQAELCKVYYFHTDQVGMPQELSNSQGQLVWQANYKTWGSTVAEEWEIKSLSGNAVHPLDQGDSPQAEDEKQQNLRFQGQYLDRETGLHYNTFRYYDADIGRFICPDPIGLNGGINLLSYSPNPISWIDPWGLAVVDATFEMGGEVFNGTNPTDRIPRVSGETVPGMSGPNSDRFGMHAEIDAMMQAHDRGIRGGTGTLTVEGKEICPYCKRSLKNIAKALGLDKLIINEKATGNTYTFEGVDLNKIREGGKGFKGQC